MKISLKRTLLSSLVLPCVLGAQYASADLINEWNYEVDSNFTNAEFTDKGGSSTGSQDTSDPNVISWGSDSDPTERSSIYIEDVEATTEGGLKTNGDYVAGGSFFHDNQSILASYDTLISFILQSDLTLTAYLPEEGVPRDPIVSQFEGAFSETLNGGSLDDCVVGSTSLCDDIFTLGNLEGLGGKEIEVDTEISETGKAWQFSQSFTVEDYTYTVFLEVLGLGVLDPTACTAAGIDGPCVGFLTAENTLNEFGTRFKITAADVPEPGTLALLGLGLAGLGLSRRKKTAK